VEKSDRKKYITERTGRSSQEQQGIVAFCTCQWNEWNDTLKAYEVLSYTVKTQSIMPEGNADSKQ
jgi:hypothetical protein